MKVLIIYCSKTGNTKKFSRAIARGIEAVEKIDYGVKPVNEGVLKR